MDPMYCTVEQVKLTTNIVAPAIMDSQIQREISTASLIIDADLKRPRQAFWPVTDTRKFDWLDHQYSLTWRLWLDGNELAAPPTQVLSAGVDITANILARNGTDESIPPFHYLEPDLSTSAAFNAGATYQRAISVTGVFLACPPDETPGGTLAAVTAGATTAVCSNGAAVGVGSVLRVDSERMIVTGKTLADSTQALQATMAASNNANVAQVVSGAAFSAGEVLTIDGEQLLIQTVAGNNLLVKRQFNGTPLLQHTSGTEVFVSRQLTLVRGALGTVAASHAANAPINVHLVPTPVQTLAIAETLRLLGLERSGYTQVVDRTNLIKVSESDFLWAQVRIPYQRKFRLYTAERFV